ncbi:lipopolysaccharide assembly protein LapB [Quadrisphaera sp. INWT6]|uniref:tetratricopeptide repeat protein n=1 Tax=Quadrisphaera sp. INWT6 TaxID=2596917 RepID=UPI002102349A|nr:tetratricopeptide repeat protein [Quadrisphaera sp. INWT6]
MLTSVESGGGQQAYDEGYDLAEEGRHVEAIEAFRRAAEVGHPDALLGWGNSLYALDRNAEAAQVFARAEAEGDVSAVLNLGLALDATGDREAAELAYRRAHDAGDPKARAVLADLWRWHGRPDDARALLREAAERGDPYAAGYLGCWLYLDADHGLQHGGEREAESVIEALLRAGAEVDDDACGDLGWLLRRRGDLDEAEQVLRTGHERGALDCSIKLAFLLEEDRGDVAAAEVVLRVAVEGGERNAYNNLANLLCDRGLLLEAERLYREGAARGDAVARQNLRRLRRDHHRQLGRAHRREHRRTSQTEASRVRCRFLVSKDGGEAVAVE